MMCTYMTDWLINLDSVLLAHAVTGRNVCTCMMWTYLTDGLILIQFHWHVQYLGGMYVHDVDKFD